MNPRWPHPPMKTLAMRNALSLVAQARTRLARAEESLAFLEHTLKQPQFTRRQAIAEARAKAETYGDLARAGLLSLANDWEEAERAILEHVRAQDPAAEQSSRS